MRILLAGIAVLCAGCAPDAAMHAKILFDGDRGLQITNTDAYGWTKCTGQINPHGLASGFEERIGDIAPGQSVTADAVEFANDDGKRFSPGEMKVSKFLIICQTPDGMAADGFTS